MKEPSLKWVLIAAIIGITVFLLAFNSYTTLLSHNNATMSNNYTLKYSELSNYSETYKHWGEQITFDDIKDIPDKILSTFLTAVSIGVSVIGELFSALTGMKDIIRMLMTDPDFSEFTIIISLLLTVFTIYLVYRILSEVRGTQPS